MEDISGRLRISRRSLLRQGTFVSGAVMIGVAAGSGTVLASDCPRTPGYWRNHDWPEYDPDDQNTDILDQVYSKVGKKFDSVEDGQDFLGQPKRGDKGLIMATHLIATILNFQYRPPPDDKFCVDAELNRFEGTVRDNKRAAEGWLEYSAFPDEQRSWINDKGVDGEPLKDALDAFNNNALGLDCDCNGSNGNVGGNGRGNGGGNDRGNDGGNGRGNGGGNRYSLRGRRYR